MAQIVWSNSARDDLAEIIEYIAFDNPAAADRTLIRILRHVRQLAKHPRSGSVPPEMPDSEYRQLVEHPCRIFYKITGNDVRIIYIVRSERILRLSRLEEPE